MERGWFGVHLPLKYLCGRNDADGLVDIVVTH